MSNLSAVYVMRSDLGFVKIGKSKSPDARLKSVAASSGAVVHLHHVTEPRADASAIEALAHKLLRAKRKSGEWFDVEVNEAVAAIAQAIDLVEHPPLPRRRGRPSGSPSLTKPISMRVDKAFLAAIGEVMRADQSTERPPQHERYDSQARVR